MAKQFIRNEKGEIVKAPAQLPEFSIKGELVGTINLTDTFKKVNELIKHKDRHKFFFIDQNRELVSHWDFYNLEEKDFPIYVIKPIRKFDTGESSCVDEIF